MKINNITDLKSSYKNADLFDLALTHRSWVNENKAPNRTHNERLEFLGDAVLEYVVSSHLYNTLPDKEEGFLTALRANIVNTKNLSEFASKVHAGKELRLSKGEAQAEGHKNPSLLANTIEAIIGSIYLDQGLKPKDLHNR
jgi:ribonuclease-3